MRKPRPYLDYGPPGVLRYQGGKLVEGQDVPMVEIYKLTLDAIRKDNHLELELQGTHRVFLRWSENEGSGLHNPEADTRETHYDPLPPAVQAQVTAMVDASCWKRFVRKYYMSTLTRKSLAEELGMTRDQLREDHRHALWYFRGRLETEKIYG